MKTKSKHTDRKKETKRKKEKKKRKIVNSAPNIPTYSSPQGSMEPTELSQHTRYIIIGDGEAKALDNQTSSRASLDISIKRASNDVKNFAVSGPTLPNVSNTISRRNSSPINPDH